MGTVHAVQMNATKLLVVRFARALQVFNSVEQLVLVSACIII